MDRVKNIIVLLAEVILVLAAIVFITVYIWTGSTEKTYSQVISDIASGNYERAAEQVKTIPHYKDSNDVAVYIYPISLFYKEYEGTEQETNGCKMALVTIERILPTMKNESYRSDLTELAKVLQFKLKKLVVLDQNKAQEQALKNIEKQLLNGELADAAIGINAINKPSMALIKSELSSYVALLNAENLSDSKAIDEAIRKLDPGYNGFMADTIQQSVLKYVDSIKWNELFKKSNETTRPYVNIGMSRNQILTLLGTPTDSSRISNKYGSCEILEYSNYGTLYFEGGKLTAYKEKS